MILSFITCNFIHTPTLGSHGHYFLGSADSEMNDDQKKEKLAELRKKEKEIQDMLGQKLSELKEICLREAVRVFMKV